MGVVAYLSRSQVRLKCETVKMEGTRLEIVLLFESFLFSTTLLVMATMIYEYEYIWSCLVQLMNEKDEQQGLNLKWLTILFAFAWFGIQAKPLSVDVEQAVAPKISIDLK